MSLKTMWIVSNPLETGGCSSYSGYDTEEIKRTFKHFNPHREIVFMSENRNEAMAFYDKTGGVIK